MGLFFPISKTAWFIAAPSHLLFWLVLVSAVFYSQHRRESRQVARNAAAASAILFFVIGVLPIGDWLTMPLENEYPRPPWPKHVDGVLVLGGGLDTNTLMSRGAPGFTSSETRLVSAFELARRYPAARVVFAGGWGPNADAYAARYIFAQMGLDANRLLLESRSRNTYENLLFARRLATPRPGQVWLLATSAIQMPRAMAVSRELNWTMVPWATEYITPKQLSFWSDATSFDVPGNLSRTDAAVHEWAGLVAYRLAHMG